MLKKSFILIFILFTQIGFAGMVVVPNDTDYILTETQHFRLIYPPELANEAATTMQLSKSIQSKYEKSFGYTMDEKLNVGLLSDNNQFANGFSTQSPFNMQMNYIGGTQMVDYFTSTSWLKVLLYHETAHNYQMNAKDNIFSEYSKKYLGNNEIPIIAGIVPFFTIPNMTLPQFITEGNATMNESWHGNGGRLYSGRAYALLMSQIKHDQIDQDLLINTTLEFPYSEEKYLIGGYFWLFLAEEYGIDKANSFFMKNSRHFINPFRTNTVFMETFGIRFDHAVDLFVKKYRTDANGYQELDGEILSTTKSISDMNRVGDTIFYFSRDLKERPILHTFNTTSGKYTSEIGRWLSGKPYRFHNQVVTASSHFDGPERIVQGLYDKNGFLIKETDSKMIQDINGTDTLYFDVKTSFLENRLFLNGQFYDIANSSAQFDHQKNIYYFKQDGKKRTLYKNKQPIYSYNGYYGFIADIDHNGNIYFIAPSQFGSSIFMLKEKTVYRVSRADNILYARIINDTEMLAATVNAEEFRYMKFTPIPVEEAPYEIEYFFEKDIVTTPEHMAKKTAPLPHEDYSMLKNLRFSSLYPAFLYTSSNGLTFRLNAEFTDPLLYNQLSLFAMRDNNKDILGGANYINTRNRLEYGAGFYGISKYEEDENDRNYGGDTFAQYQLYRKGYHTGFSKLRFYMDDEIKDKNPITLKIGYRYHERQPLNLYPNIDLITDFYGKYDREDTFAGGDIKITRRLPFDIFLGAKGRYVYSDAEKAEDGRGIKLTDNLLKPNTDVTTFQMLGLSGNTYAKEVWSAKASIKMQFDYSKYFFTFPISLRREAIYASYEHFNLTHFNDATTEVNETVVGATFDLLFVNIAPLPLSIEYIHNDTTKDTNKVRLVFNIDY